MSHEIWLSNPAGQHLALLDKTMGFGYSRALNAPGAWSVLLPADFDTDLLALDSRLEFWRRANAISPLRFMALGLLRTWTYKTDERGTTSLVIGGHDQNRLLRRRIVAFAAGTSQAEKNMAADDMMKEVVRQNLGADAAVERQLVGFPLTVQANTTLAPVLNKKFSYRYVDDILKELAQDSEERGTPLYFEIASLSPTAFEFRTYVNYPGVDHSSTSAAPVTIGVEAGTLEDPSFLIDHADEHNFAYAGGVGEGLTRTVRTKSDMARMTASPWNRCETFVDAREETTDAGVDARAEAGLREGRPRRVFGGAVRETDQARLGVEWNFGDLLTATYRRQQYPAMVRALAVQVDTKGKETVTARLEVTD